MSTDPMQEVFAVADELFALNTDGDLDMIAATDRHAARVRDSLRLYGIDTNDPVSVRAVAATWAVLAALVDGAFERDGIGCMGGGHNAAVHTLDGALQAFGIALRQLNNSVLDAAALVDLELGS